MAFTPQGVPTQGLGFAIPAEEVRNSVAGFKKIAASPRAAATPETELAAGNADRLFGLQLQDLTPELSQALGYASGRGVLVTAVEPDSPADTAGFERGLVIYRVGRYEVNSVKQLEKLLDRVRSGGNVAFVVGIVRDNGEQRLQNVTLSAR
jgi:serine protease Do